MARSGYECAKLLSNYNNKILVTDMKEQDENNVNEMIINPKTNLSIAQCSITVSDNGTYCIPSNFGSYTATECQFLPKCS